MSFAQLLDRYGLYIWAPLLCLGALGLFFTIRNTVRMARKPPVASLPLVERQEVQFPEAGRVVLNLEGPPLTSRFASLTYDLRTDYGSPVAASGTVFHSTRTTFTKVRQEMYFYEIPHPGRYILTVGRLGPAQPRDAMHGLVFTRPHRTETFANVAGIVLSGLLFIGSLVFLILNLTGARFSS